VTKAQGQARKPHVVVVDDDPVIRDAVIDYLGTQGFQVSAAANGATLLAVIADGPVDLLLLDVRLGREDGMVIARRLREESQIPIIMLTGQREEPDRVMGLELGADDYVTKPFSNRELLARIRAVLRRKPEMQQGRPEGVRAYRFDGWELNLNLRRLTSPHGKTVKLSNNEFSLLVVFLGAPQRILSRNHLLELSRLHSDDVYNRSVDTQIMRLRRKLDAERTSRYIHTERGEGYVFNGPVETVY